MTLDDIQRINERINKDDYIADPPGIDDWRPDASVEGKDCDSYAVAKLRAIAALGGSALLAVVYTETGECHLVCLVELHDGWYVLDNRQLFPVPVREITERYGYKTHLVQQEMGSEKWDYWTGVKV